jgi:hypothetical protein
MIITSHNDRDYIEISVTGNVATPPTGSQGNGTPPTPIQESERVNGWDERTYETVAGWQSDIAESSFIYGEQLEIYDGRMNVALVLALITGVIMTVIAGVTVSLSTIDEVSKWLPFSFEVVMLIGAAIITASNGLITVLGWDEKVKQLTKYIGKLDSQWAVFETELMIPPEQRQNGLDFIKREDGNYMHLMQQSPHMSADEYIQAKESYTRKMKEHHDRQVELNAQP